MNNELKIILVASLYLFAGMGCAGFMVNFHEKKDILNMVLAGLGTFCGCFSAIGVIIWAK